MNLKLVYNLDISTISKKFFKNLIKNNENSTLINLPKLIPSYSIIFLIEGSRNQFAK